MSLFPLSVGAVPQEVKVATGSGAVKGKEALGLYEVTVSRKETPPCRYWNYEPVFIFPLRLSEDAEGNREGGALQACPLMKCVPSIYSNS